MLIKILNLIQTLLICCLAICSNCNCPITQQQAFLCPRRKVIFPCQNDIQRYNCSVQTCSCNYSCLFAIPLLSRPRSTSPFSTCYNHFRSDLAYTKPSLVKVLYILLLDSILVNCVLYKPKLHVIHIWIFAEDSLIINLLI